MTVEPEDINNYLKDLLNGNGDNKNYDNHGKTNLVLKEGDKRDNLYKRILRDLINKL